MKRFFGIVAIIALVGSVSASSMGNPVGPQAQTEQQGQASTFTGTIVTGHMKGGIGNPHLFAEVQGDDGQKVTFILRKSTTVTASDGKTLNFMRDFRKGKKVEIKYEVKSGQNEAISMHYLD